LKTCMAVTVERSLFNMIEQLRGREKRSTFVEHLLRLGLEVYQMQMSEGGEVPNGLLTSPNHCMIKGRRGTQMRSRLRK